MKGPTNLADKKRADAKIAALRPPVRGVGPTSTRIPQRPVVVLADVARMPAKADQHAVLDGPRVQSNNRVVLTNCCTELGWVQGTELSFTVGDGQVVLRRDEGERVVRIGTRCQLTLTPGMLLALGLRVDRDSEDKPTIVALADPVEGTVRLLGAAALEDAERFTRLARPIRDVLNQLGGSVSVSQLTLVLRLLTNFDPAQLAALAAIDPSQLAALLEPTPATTAATPRTAT
jgi:hypothetical protein